MATTEPISFFSTEGVRLAGIIHHSKSPTPDTCVVIAHGMLSSMASDKHRLICETAAAAGAVALRFDFRGRGESEGDPAILTVSNEVEDLAAAIAFARHRGCARTLVVGSSLGGTVAILTGADDGSFSGLVTIAAPARLPRAPRHAWGGSGRVDSEARIEIAPGEFIDREFFADAARHDVLTAARRIDCPWLIIHGAADQVVPSEDAVLLAENAPGAELVIHPTAGHRFDLPEERCWLIELVATFLESRY